MGDSKITWTKVDEAPALASHSLLPILRAYTKATGVEIELSDSGFHALSELGKNIHDEYTHLSRLFLTRSGPDKSGHHGTKNRGKR